MNNFNLYKVRINMVILFELFEPRKSDVNDKWFKLY